ncbi:MAG: Lrp/AsnC family transcriptional regulator [Intrasporangium sp.]|uniref:Lrp/AsnC family transcriptional regulator n=1 Tax=Intrasporangium sp. TaxID=1925024 RepID=UPI0026489D6C|nr:Lrp/AsnC family transcriptional regulator [Intrasporangium sp.]MDN5795206.1 Lrp/AsnC family transcriptional regulator [Intrasporangium sp.]
MPHAPRSVDELDCRILLLILREPGIGVLGASRRLGVARGTVQARLDRLQAAGVLPSMAPPVDPASLGFPVTAFCTLEIRQGQGHEPVIEHLSAIPEVLEANTITGSGDLLIRIVGRDNADLQRVLDRVIDDTHVTRASTAIALETRIGHRTVPLVERLLEETSAHSTATRRPEDQRPQ